jgi:hypothetical protein
MKTSLVAILSAFALINPAQGSSKVRGVAEEKKVHQSRTLKGMKGMKAGMKGDMMSKGAGKMEKEEDLAIYFSLISAAQEVAPCESQALGNALVTLNATSSELCMQLSYSGLSGPQIFSHIHGPAKIGENAPSLFLLSMGTIKTDCVILDAEQTEYLYEGYLYFNIHSEMCRSGEIRGQIV